MKIILKGNIFISLLSLKPDSSRDHHLIRELIDKGDSDSEARGPTIPNLSNPLLNYKVMTSLNITSQVYVCLYKTLTTDKNAWRMKAESDKQLNLKSISCST